MRNLSYNIVYKAGGAKHVCNSESCEHFSLNVEEKDNILSVAINPKCPISFENLTLFCLIHIAIMTRFLLTATKVGQIVWNMSLTGK